MSKPKEKATTEYDAMVGRWAAQTMAALHDMELPNGSAPALLLHLSISVCLSESVSKKVFLSRASDYWDAIEKERRKILDSLSDA